MKKILTLAACAALCTSTLLADIKIGDTTYNTLEEAISNATETDVITLSGEYTQTKRLDITTPITITGTDNAVIKGSDTNNIIILVKKDTNGALKMSNVVIDGDNKTWNNRNLIEINTAGNELTNIIFKNAGTTHNGGLMRSINKGRVTLENVTVENCTINEGRGEFFCGTNDGITIKGNNAIQSIYIENNYRIRATDLTNTDKIKIIVEGAKRKANDPVISGYSDPSKFEFIGCADGCEIETVGEDLKYVIYVAAHNGVNYKTLKDAHDNAKGSEVKNITIINDLELGDRQLFEVPDLVVSGKTGNETITKNFGGKLLFGANKTTTLKNMTINLNNNSGISDGHIEAGNGNLTLDNVTFSGLSTDGGYTVYAKSQAGRRVTLNNVKGGASVLLKYDTDNTRGASAIISGNNAVSFTMENAANQITVANEGVTNTTPIEITYADGANISSDNIPENTVVVKNCTDPTKFFVTNTGLTLAAKDGNLILAKAGQNGVEDVMVEDADAPVEWFNLQGIRVANPENGIYIRRQGNKVEKVVL